VVQIGSYATLSELGRGGQGVVFRCRAPDGRDVAVKILLRATPGGHARFERERRLLASLGEDAGFVPILDTGETPRGPFFVMPLLEGGTLRARLEKGPLGVDQTIALGTRLASALALAHAQGIVHRDLKPENVLFSRDGVAFVSDLGLAKHFVPDAAGLSQSVGLSRTGELRGTAGYMAPEQARDARKVGPPADVFALGAILYECLAGFPAFQAETVLALLGKVENETPAEVRKARSETPVWLARVVAKALARKPEDRFVDAGALQAALASKERSGMGRRSRGALVALLLCGVAVAGIGATLLQRSTRPSPAPAPSPAPSPGAEHAPDPLEQALASVSGNAPVTSADVPTKLILSARDEARRKLIAKVLGRVIVYSVEDARALERRDPGMPEVGSLVGLALLVFGPPDQRSEATRLIQGSSGSSWLIPAIARAAVEVDAVAVALGGGLPPPRGLDPHEWRRVLRALPEEVAAAILQPLVDPAESVLLGRERELLSVVVPLDESELSSGWDLATVSPRLALVLRLARRHESVADFYRALPTIDTLAPRIALDDPRLAVHALEVGTPYWSLAGFPGTRDSFERDMSTLSLLSRTVRDPDLRERSRRLMSIYRVGWAFHVVFTEPSPAPKDVVSDGLAAARELDNASTFLSLAFEAGVIPGEEDRAFLETAADAPLLAEWDRVRGRPRSEALARVRDTFRASSSFYAVVALIEADSGNFERAHEFCDHIGEYGLILRRFHKEAVSRYIDEKEKR
jgi:hypothetical protein